MKLHFRLIVAMVGLAVIFFSWKTGHLTDTGALGDLAVIAVALVFSLIVTKRRNR